MLAERAALAASALEDAGRGNPAQTERLSFIQGAGARLDARAKT